MIPSRGSFPSSAARGFYTGVDAQGAITSEPAKRGITIRDLLTHTSGLGYLFDSKNTRWARRISRSRSIRTARLPTTCG